MRKPMIIAGLATAAALVVGGGVAVAGVQETPTPAASSSAPAPAPSTPAGTPSTSVPTDDDRKQGEPAPAVAREAAEKTALAQVPGGKVTEAELDTENNTQVWEFDVTGTDGVENEITVNATSGAVIANEKDDDTDEQDDQDDATDDQDDANDVDDD
ncbi:PepSY domain-containing protein [Sphaerisporangium sp. TRM90804]|uniref:PepSY domain-containing protein n=1 Tax=Sphaerisporangium sp. TRM90804 TaxID=3031113 RepID=UPI00244BE1FA|nr:PepSY domain-containing protein [Sphaerisporangium sp. TRM90804]MDH2429593.1 PepSY domain-containing protein [Sphaerisporangium sp. TRM90804]